jgi:hypothetical protein
MSGFSRFVAQMALLMVVTLAVVFLPAYAASRSTDSRPLPAPVFAAKQS